MKPEGQQGQQQQPPPRTEPEMYAANSFHSQVAKYVAMVIEKSQEQTRFLPRARAAAGAAARPEYPQFQHPPEPDIGSLPVKKQNKRRPLSINSHSKKTHLIAQEMIMVRNKPATFGQQAVRKGLVDLLQTSAYPFPKTKNVKSSGDTANDDSSAHGDMAKRTHNTKGYLRQSERLSNAVQNNIIQMPSVHLVDTNSFNKRGYSWPRTAKWGQNGTRTGLGVFIVGKTQKALSEDEAIMEIIQKENDFNQLVVTSPLKTKPPPSPTTATETSLDTVLKNLDYFPSTGGTCHPSGYSETKKRVICFQFKVRKRAKRAKLVKADALFNPGVKIKRHCRGFRTWPLKPPKQLIGNNRMKARDPDPGSVEQSVDARGDKQPTPTLAFHEPLQLLRRDREEGDREEQEEDNKEDKEGKPKQVLNMMNPSKPPQDGRHKRERVAMGTVSLPRKGRIKLTALSYELANPEYYDDRREAADKRELLTSYTEQVLGPALPNPSPEGSLIRNRSILRQVKSDVRRLEREKEEEEGIREALEGDGMASLVEHLLKYEMSEVPGINSNLQTFVSKVKSKQEPDQTNSTNSVATNSSFPTTTIDTDNTKYSSDSSINNQRQANISDDFRKQNNNNQILQESMSHEKCKNVKNHLHHNRHHHGGSDYYDNTNNTDNNEIYVNLNTPRHLPVINSSTASGGGDYHSGNNRINVNTSAIAITTPRKAFEEMIRNVETTNNMINHTKNNKNNNNNNSTYINGSYNRTLYHSPYSSPRSALWYQSDNINNNTLSNTDKITSSPTSGFESFQSLNNSHDELSLHSIIKNAQKIASNQLHKSQQNQKITSRDLSHSTITVLDLGSK